MNENKREYASSERSPVIDPELRDLLPPITDAERAALTADILKNGCYSPMICMADMTLVDGHHRYEICTEHDIPYRMVILAFEDKLEAKEWMVNTQKGRRNLTIYQLGQIALKLKSEIEAKARAKQSEAGGDKKSAEAKSLSATLPEAIYDESQGIDTRKELAKAVDIGERTMGKIMQIDESAPGPIKEALEKQDISVNQAYNAVKNLEAVPEEEREAEAERMVILGAAPFAACGFVRYHGLTAEQFIVVWFRSEFLMPERLTCIPENTYAAAILPALESKQAANAKWCRKQWKVGAVAKQPQEKRSQVVAKAATKAPFSGKIEL